MADHDATRRILLARRQRPAFDDVVEPHRDVVGDREHDLAKLANPPLLFGPQQIAGGDGIGERHGLICRVAAIADQPQAADHLHRLALHDILGAHVGVALAHGVLELLRARCGSAACGPGRDGFRSA